MLSRPRILDKVRSEEGKVLRRQYRNDIGVPYQAAKGYAVNTAGCCNCVTTFTTDNNIIHFNTNPMETKPTHKEHPTKQDLLEYFSDRIRIRKMTEREALRLMDVDDTDIDRMKAYPFKTLAEREAALAVADKKEANRIKREGISKTNLYKCAGNSIVVSCLYHIFRTMFLPGQPENQNKPKVVQTSIFDFA